MTIRVPADDGIFEPDWNASEEEWTEAVTKLQAWLEGALVGQWIGYTHQKRCCAPPLGCGKVLIGKIPTRFNKALCQGHIYSDAGMAEVDITGLCEHCFDRITKEPEEDPVDCGL